MLVGKTIRGYTFLSVLRGDGGSTVYEAKDDSGRLVVIKEIHRQDVALRNREVEMQRRCDHPNVAKVFDAWTGYRDQGIGSDLLIVVEHCGKRDLASIDRSVEAIRKTIIGVLHGLQHIHDQGIIHCDIKLENIMLTDSGPKILDFELARDRQPPHGRAWISPFYKINNIPPDECLHGTCGPQTDVYAAGCLFDYLAGTLPPVHPQLRTVINRMMAPLLEDRYQTAAEAAHALETEGN